MSKDRPVYPAVFHYADDGITVTFPDLPGCITCGDTQEEALAMAKEALALHLFGMEQDDETIPVPCQARTIATDADSAIVLIEVWMPPFRDEMENRAVKKTLTIPKWLADSAAEHHINFSRVLQEGLKERLGIDGKSPR